ncbi:hypothetical protein ACJ41O_005181 [Fusarium nematophilum]
MEFAARRAAILAKKELTERSLAIKIWPAPVTFIERRAILQALERYGQVEFFKSSAGHDSIFVSLMKDSEAASRVASASPITFAVPISKPSRVTTLTKEPEAPAGKFGPLVAAMMKEHSSRESDKQETSRGEFTLEVLPPAEGYRHHASGSLSNPWPDFVDENKSFLSETLKQSLPGTMAARGLSHWDPDLGKQPVSNARMVGRLQLRNWIPSKFSPSSERPEQESTRDMAQGDNQPSQDPAGQATTTQPTSSSV